MNDLGARVEENACGNDWPGYSRSNATYEGDEDRYFVGHLGAAKPKVRETIC